MAAGGGAAPPARRAGTPVGRRGAGGKNLGRQRGVGREATAVPGRSRLRFLVLEALADGAGAGLRGIAAGIATACLGTGAAAPGARLPGGPGRELDRNVELAAGDMEHAGLVRRGTGGRMQITAGGRALLGRMGEAVGEAGFRGGGGAGGRRGRMEGKAGNIRQLPARAEPRVPGMAGRRAGGAGAAPRGGRDRQDFERHCGYNRHAGGRRGVENARLGRSPSPVGRAVRGSRRGPCAPRTGLPSRRSRTR